MVASCEAGMDGSEELRRRLNVAEGLCGSRKSSERRDAISTRRTCSDMAGDTLAAGLIRPTLCEPLELTE
jgi:hypothetical protein